MTCPGHPNGGGMCWRCAPPGHLPTPEQIEANWARFRAMREAYETLTGRDWSTVQL